MLNRNLLTGSDAKAFYIHNIDATSNIVIICDHASDKIPKSLGYLGLNNQIMDSHIAYDIGAANIAKILSEKLNAPSILAGFSRLVIDINRPIDDFTLIREISDGIVIQGNRHITNINKQQRIDEIYAPYHRAIKQIIDKKHCGKNFPAIISIHSCTDKMNGKARPWHIGVLMNKDRRMGEKLMAILAAQNPDIYIGDNKPYSGMDPYGYSIETHAIPAKLPNVLLEIRQDLIRSVSGQKKWAKIIANAMIEVIDNNSLFKAF